MDKKMNKIIEDWNMALIDFFKKTNLKEGAQLIVGCSTSEVKGKSIGSASSQEIGRILFEHLQTAANLKKVHLAIQCCEHLNRAIILERETAERFQYSQVNVVPSLDAGGAFSLAAFEKMKDPIAVERIQADAGLDIGDTFIGMHLKEVAVPIRLNIEKIGEAHLTAARTRSKYIGGERAKYRADLK